MYLRQLCLAAVAVVLLLGAESFAQTITGSVHGTVTDPSGAVVAGATVTATNIETNQVTRTTTNNVGVYNIRFLQIGHYNIAVTYSGFHGTAIWTNRS